MTIQRPTIPRHPTKSYPTRYLADITHIIVHHSLTRTGSAAAYARFHISEYNWPGIAYHFVIDPDGTINGTLRLENIGYHCKGMNMVGIGVVLTGNFDKTDPTPAQIESLAHLIVYLRREIGRKLEVGRHNEYSQKTCPGTRFPWDALVQRVAILEYTGPPSVKPEDPDEKEPDVVMPDDPEEPPEPDHRTPTNKVNCLMLLVYAAIGSAFVLAISSIF